MDRERKDVFAISDLHLPFAKDTRLTGFGDHWSNHEDKLSKYWDQTISSDDIVLVPGDISWAPNANKAGPDMAWLAERSGQIYLSQGNHDRWWRSPERLREVIPTHCESIHREWKPFFGGLIGSVIGMTSPADRFFREYEKKRWPRAIRRLEKMLLELREIRRKRIVPFVILMMHYPPCSGTGESSEIGAMIGESSIDLCVYGHFHRQEEWASSWNGMRQSTEWRFVSCDALSFHPIQVGTIEGANFEIMPYNGAVSGESNSCATVEEEASVRSAEHHVYARSPSVHTSS